MTTETAHNAQEEKKERTGDQPGHIRWRELCKTGKFSDMPYKVETNARGQVMMSPTALYHRSWQSQLVLLLRDHLTDGHVIVEAGVETADGTKIADVAGFRSEH